MYMLGRHSHVHSFSIGHVNDSNVGQGWSPLTQVRQVHSVGRGDTAQPHPIDPHHRDKQLEQQFKVEHSCKYFILATANSYSF